MRLWHYLLVPHLPRQLLNDQHRTCCGLRGRGWGKRQRTIGYVWNYPIDRLVGYHQLVMSAMRARGYAPNPSWDNPAYRGRFTGTMPAGWTAPGGVLWIPFDEHDRDRLLEDIALLDKKLSAQKKGVNTYTTQERAEWCLAKEALTR